MNKLKRVFNYATKCLLYVGIRTAKETVLLHLSFNESSVRL